MTYDQRTKDLAHAIFCLDEAGRILVSARLAVRWLGFEEDEQTLWEMTMKLDEVCRKVNDTLGDYVMEGLEKKEEEEDVR